MVEEEKSDSLTNEDGDVSSEEGEIDYKTQVETVVAERDKAQTRIKQLEDAGKSRQKTWMQQQDRDKMLLGLQEEMKSSREVNAALVDALTKGDTDELAGKVQEIETKSQAARTGIENREASTALINTIFEQAEEAGLDPQTAPEFEEIRAEYDAIRASPNPQNLLSEIYQLTIKAGQISTQYKSETKFNNQIKDLENRLSKSQENAQEVADKAEEEGFITDTGRSTPVPRPTTKAQAAKLYNEGKITSIEYAKYR